MQIVISTINLPEVMAAVTGVISPSKITELPKIDETSEGEPIKWGTSNTLPTDYRNLIESNPVLSTGIKYLARTFTNQGITYGQWDDKTKDLVKSFNPELRSWLRSFNSNRLMMDFAFEYFSFGQAFIRVILSSDGKKIARMFCEQSMYVRYQAPADGKPVSYVLIHGDWSKTPSVEDCVRLPLLDPYKTLAEQFAAKPQAKEWIYPITDQSSGYEFYMVPSWYTASKSGWLNVANSIPKIKQSEIKNMAAVRKHIEIHNEYWATAIPDFAGMEPADQQKAIEKKLAEITDLLSGEANAGKSLITSKGRDSFGGDVSLTIKELSQKIAEGGMTDDSSEANDHILFALGLDGSLIGKTPGKSVGAGSGSDKRVAQNNLVSGMYSDQQTFVTLIEEAAAFNGFTEVFWIENAIIQTLNNVTPSQRNAVN